MENDTAKAMPLLPLDGMARLGINPESLEGLSIEYSDYCIRHGLDALATAMSADELAGELMGFSDGLYAEQVDWLLDFCRRWDARARLEDAAKRGDPVTALTGALAGGRHD